MSVKPKTIDNLGIESSIRYAKDMEIFDKRLVEESRLIAQKTEVTVAKPYAPSEFDLMFSPVTQGRSILWAAFQPPPHFYGYAKSLFSYQLIPSLGSPEKLDADSDKLSNLEDVLNKPFARKREGQDQEKDQKEEERERQVLLALLKTINKLDRTLSLINSRRNQYQRG